MAPKSMTFQQFREKTPPVVLAENSQLRRTQSLLVNMAVLLLIFVPKIRYKEAQHRTEQQNTFAGSESRIKMNHGTGSVAITGLNLSMAGNDSIIENTQQAGDYESDDDEGMRVLTHPKELEMLEGEIECLKKEYNELKKQKAPTLAAVRERRREQSR